MSNETPKGAALITGASTGIGAVYAERLAHRGHDLILAARDAGRLEALATRLRAETGVKVEVVRTDLTDKADVVRLEQRLLTDGAISVLINNAGANVAGRFATVDADALDDLIQLNVTAVTRLAHAAAKAFVKAGRGTIVNLGSVVALVPEYGAAVYGATKAYVLYLSQALDHELRGSGVRVQAVLPGATRTEIWDRSGAGTAALDPARIMDVGELVDGALAGLDQGEVVSIISLLDPTEWDTYQAARVAMSPNFSNAHPAPRYGIRVAEPA